jgi:outer membrane protein assembly factor BamA
MDALVRPLLTSALLVLVLSSAPGCISRMAKARSDAPTVLKVKIVGNKAFADGAIREELAQRQTSVLHFIPPFTFFQPRYYLDGTDWRDDRERIVTFYGVRGFFDATITSSQVVSGRRKRPDGDPEFVKVVHTVREGAPSFVRTVRINVRADTALKESLEAALEKETTFGVGDRFSMQAVEDTESALVRALQDRAFATAKARSVVDAFPDDHSVDVTFVVEPGPESVFGEVRILGLDKVAERYVLRHVFTKAGAPWEGSAVQKTKREVYGMGVFTMVTLTPGIDPARTLDAQGRLIVPVDIDLRERKPRSFEYSPGFAWDTQGFTLLPLDITFGQINLGRRLVQATATFKGGYRYLSPTDHFPTAAASLEFKWPDFPARNLSLRARGDVDLGVERGYKFWTPGAAVGLGAAPLPWLKLDVSYNLQYYDILPESWRIGPVPEVTSPCPEVGKLPGDCTPPSDALEPQYDDNYLLSYTRESIVLDLRDSPLAAGQGVMLQLASDQAFPFGRLPDGSLLGFRYVKLEAELRGYLPIVKNRLVLASRVGGAHMITWGEEHNLPINKAVYLGGDGTVRGFRARYLGPRAVEKDCSRNDCVVPLGARSGLSGSVEVRARPVGGLWLAAFTDFGRTWGDASTDTNVASDSLVEYQDLLYRDGLQFSVGGGIRYDLAIGRVRLDFAARIRKWPEELQTFREPFPWNIHFNLSESF